MHIKNGVLYYTHEGCSDCTGVNRTPLALYKQVTLHCMITFEGSKKQDHLNVQHMGMVSTALELHGYIC